MAAKKRTYISLAFPVGSDEDRLWKAITLKHKTNVDAFRELIFNSNAEPEGEKSNRQMLTELVSEVGELRRDVAELKQKLSNYEGDGK